MSFREPFEQLRLSNRIGAGDSNGFGGNGPDFDHWRATVDTFRTFLAGDTSGNP